MRYRCAVRVGEGSDPELAPDGWEQARRPPAALQRVRHQPPGEQPRNAARPPDRRPVAAPSACHVDIDDRMAEYDLACLTTCRWKRSAPNVRTTGGADGRWSAARCQIDTREFTARVLSALQDIVGSADHTETVAVFSHGG